MSISIRAAVAIALTAFAGDAFASDTLTRLKETGEIRLGYREVSIPFSYLDADQKPVGFAMDLCASIVDEIRAETGLNSLKTKLQPIQLGNQIPLIENGTIDIVCGPATNTLERQKVVAFSNTIFVSSLRAVVRKDSPIKTFDDLADRAVSLTAGSTSIGLLAKRAQEKGFQTKNVVSADHAASFLALTTGRTEAFVMDDILLASLVATSTKPGDYRLIDDSLRVEPYGLVIRKGDPGFKTAVDRALAKLMRNGGFEKLYGKWFTGPIPPKGTNLAFPMTPALREVVDRPNDKGI